MIDIKEWLPEFEVSAETDTELQEYFLLIPELEKNCQQQVIDDWSNQFPKIENLFSVLQTIQVETFTFLEFENKYRIELPKASEGDVRKHLNFLFDNSIIGQKKQERWDYLSSLPNLKMNIEKPFRTHQSFKYRLQLIESRPGQNEEK